MVPTVRAALAMAFFVAVGLAAGCGRSLPNRDGQASPGDTALDGKSDRADGGSAGDVGVDVAGPDLAADAAADVPVDVAPDAQVDRPDGGQADMNAPDVRAEAGQDLTPDRQPEAGQDLASDRNPDVDPNCGKPYDVRHCGTCDHDCTKLPHVDTSIESLSCQNGVCISNICQQGYANCALTSGDRACETDLWNDTKNCGGCGIVCGQRPGSSGVCHKGACVGECPAERGDCTDDFGCETHLSTPDHCGACGRPACGLANVVAPCRQPGSASCNDGVCVLGYGNCERTSPDCEAAYGSAAGTCLPTYKGTRWLPTGENGVTAVRPDGARFIGGRFVGSVDFDFTTGVDMRVAPAAGWPYVTMVKADSSYGWTRTFTASSAQSAVTALAASPDGGVIIGGNFRGTIVLEPGGQPQGDEYTYSAFIVKLTGNGAFVWGFVLERSSGSFANIGSLVVAGDGSIFVGGGFGGQVDFDPGPATVLRNGTAAFGGNPFLLKLANDARFRWVDTWDVDPAKCVVYPGRLAPSPAETVWVSGSFGGSCDFDPGSGVDVKQIGGGTGGTGYVLAVDAAGSYVGTWTFGRWISDLATDGQGAVYAVGDYSETVDFDPGPADVSLTATDYPSSFMVKLSASGAFQWVTTPTRFSAGAVALGRDGSVLVAGLFGADGIAGAGVIQLLPDQSPGWTVGFGSSNLRISSLATTANGIFVGGLVYQISDMDPGPGVDSVPNSGPEGNPFISEYAY